MKEKIAYLCSEYPALSHTFIFREIQSIRQSGLEVVTASIRPASHVSLMTHKEQQEADQTFVITKQPLTAMLKAHLTSMRRSPRGYFSMALQALRLVWTGPKSPLKALGYFAEAGILIPWLHDNNVTHIHEHFGNPTAIVALLIKKYGAATYSVSIHGPDIFYTVDSAMLREKVIHASFVRCISHYCTSQIMRITPFSFWENLHIVRCGIDPDIYTPREPRTTGRVEILCVGRLVPAKGQHLLLGAAQKLQKEGLDFHITFIGDGPDRESLEALSLQNALTDRVLFTGPLGQDEVRKYYDTADIFVLPSCAEGVPVVLMEAMSKEIPVISTRITGIPELIDHDHDGLLATPGDAQDLARQMRQLMEDPAKRIHLGKKGREKVQLLYNQHLNNSRLADIFLQQGEK